MKQSDRLRNGLLSPTAIIFLKKIAKQGAGILTLSAAILFCLLLSTYDSRDISFNTITQELPANFLGLPGAYIADVLLQFFGLASFIWIPPFLLVGIILIFGFTFSKIYQRLLSLLISFLIATMVLGFYPNQTMWLVSPSLGGACGYLMVTHLKGIVSYNISLIIAGGSAVLGLFLYNYSLGIPFSVWKGFSLNCFKWSRWVILKNKKEKKNPSDSKSTILRSKTGLQDREDNFHSPSFTTNAYDSNIEEQDQILFDKSKEDTYFEKADDLYLNTESEFYRDEIVPPSVTKTYKNESVSQRKILPSSSEDYELPTIDLLDDQRSKTAVKKLSPEVLEQSASQLKDVLQEFGVKGEIVQVTPGPVVTLYELKPAPGIKTSRVIGLADDIARSMSALSARIAVVPGRNVIGIELPNPVRETVFLRDLLLTPTYSKTTYHLPLILGKDIGGAPIIADMARMPHVLVAGTTGSGKSVAINTMIMSILFKLSPEKCRFIMIDPKMLELSIYDGIPHLLTPVVTDPKKAIVALKWAVKEMENRYRSMAKLGVRNIDGYNARIAQARASGEMLVRRVQTGFDPDSGKPVFENQSLDIQPLPYIIVVVDEMADLMLVAGKEIEAAVQRLAQMARAAGIHLIMATQRPSVDVITGTIKANFPTRMSFQVSSKIDSRTILGEQGAEQLLGQGDMLYMAGGGRVMRVHGPFVRDDEVENVVNFLKAQGEPTYEESIVVDEEEKISSEETEKSGNDPLYQQAVELVQREGKASTSFVQRYLQIGYNRAARIIEQMEKDGHISPANHVGKREVLR